MGWSACEKKHIRRVEADENKIKSIIKVADARLKAIQQIKKDKETVSIITEGYYEVIKEFLTALLLKNGLKSDNHECLISYFKKEYGQYEHEIITLYELKNIRNRINYDGIFVKESYLEMNELEFKHIISLLKKMISEENE